MYHNLVTTGVASFRINQTVIFGYTVNSHPLYHPTKPIRPYQTLLLLHDPKRVIENGSNRHCLDSDLSLSDSLTLTRSLMHRSKRQLDLAHIYSIHR